MKKKLFEMLQQNPIFCIDISYWLNLFEEYMNVPKKKSPEKFNLILFNFIPFYETEIKFRDKVEWIRTFLKICVCICHVAVVFVVFVVCVLLLFAVSVTCYGIIDCLSCIRYCLLL